MLEKPQKNKLTHFIFLILIQFSLSGFAAGNRPATTTPLTLLHTNDLHSHFQPEKGELQLGGVARIKTMVDRLRNENPNTLLVDGGDWSEGQIYYNEGVGAESLRMMDELGYDFGVIGNHDWLNGPDILVGIFNQVQPKTVFLSSNLSTGQYASEKKLRDWILPYAIKEVAGVKIAFIGLSTYEKIYDRYFDPVKPSEPFLSTRRLAARLKSEGADVVIALSHNGVLANQAILKIATEVDLVIGAHDHRQLNHPIVVSRMGGKDAWIVETGKWGRYLGRVDLAIAPGYVELLNYNLIQMDSTVPEDPDIKLKVAQLESKLESEYGDIFHDQAGTSEIELNHENSENLLGNFVTESYLKAANVSEAALLHPELRPDIAIDSTKFIYGDIYRGPLTTADLMNVVPAIFNPKTKKSWTLQILPVKGSTLRNFFNLLLTTEKFGSLGWISASGVSLVFQESALGCDWSSSRHFYESHDVFNGFSDCAAERTLEELERSFNISEMTVRGKEILNEKVYHVATSPGMIESINFINKNLISTGVDLDQAIDTGVEVWQVLASYLKQKSPLKMEMVTQGDHLISSGTDLGIYPENIQITPIPTFEGGSLMAEVGVQITNYGRADLLPQEGDGEWGEPARVVPDPTLRLVINKKGLNLGTDPEWITVGDRQPIPFLKSGESALLKWKVILPRTAGLVPLAAQIEGASFEANHTNHQALVWLKEGVPISSTYRH